MNRKNLLLCGVSALSIAAMCDAALAQEQLETVTVTGIRASMQSAQTIKQNSDQVVDSITAVDIGALPDRSVAEALQRVPGIQLTRTDALRDPIRYGGTGNGVFIRGLSWVSALTNGRDTFSAANGRTLSFADISANLMAGVDVYKNPDARMIEGGVGGTVDLRTRKPFDQDGLKIAASADVTYGALVDAATPSVNVLVSDRWETKIGEFGALFSVDYQVQKNRTSSFSVGEPYGANVTLPDGSTGHIPASSLGNETLDWRTIDWTQSRTAFDTTLQYRPNEKLEITLTGIFSKAEPHEGEYKGSILLPTTYSPAYTFASDGTWTGGTLPNLEMRGNDTRVGEHHNTNADYSLNVKYNPIDALEITADLQYSESRAYMRSTSVYLNQIYNGWTSKDHTWSGPDYTVFPGAPQLNPVLNLTGHTPVMTYSDADKTALANPNNAAFGAAMDHLENNYAHNWAGRVDATYKLPGNGLFNVVKSVEFGFRREDKTAVTRQTGYNWKELSYQPWFGGQDDMASQVRFANDPSMKNDMTLRNFGLLFGSDMPSLWLVKASSLLGKDTRDTATLLATVKGPLGGWVPYAGQHAASCDGIVDYKCQAVYEASDPKSDNVSGGINHQGEITHAGYVSANFAHDTFLGYDIPIDGNVGVRFVATEDSVGAGYVFYPSSNSGCWVADCSGYNTTNAFVGNGGAGGTVVTAAPTKNTYFNVLPSFNLRAHLTDQLQFRTGYSQAIVRPDFSFTQNYTSLVFNYDSSGGLYRPDQPFTAGGGNPNLKPMKAQQYDASLEYYFSSTGSLTFAVFHKTLSNYFLTETNPESIAPNTAAGGTGSPMTFYVTRTQNGGKGTVEGFELAYQQFFDTLPGAWSGLGLQVNYTKIYNHGGGNAVQNVNEAAQVSNHSVSGLPIEGMSNDSANLALLYAKYGIDFRLAYNWRSRYLMTSSAANANAPVWQENYGQLDASVFYDFLDHYKVGVQATNLMNATTVLDIGNTNYHPRYDWIDTDQKISFILRASW